MTGFGDPSSMGSGAAAGTATGRQLLTPLADALLEYRRGDTAAFHTPGHKLGAGAPPGLVEAVGERMLAADIGVANGIEDTQESQGLVQQAEALAAEAWGADRAFFLVNGSTSGMQAVVLTVAGPGDTVIVPRNSHKSLLAALIFSGAEPVYVEPTIDPEWGVAVNVPTERVLAALRAHPEARAVFVTSPSYNGFCADVSTLAEHVHAAGMPLIVDQAWGAHLRFCSALPVDALAAGADAAVTSVHKLLSGLSQASVVLARGGRIDLDRLRTLVKMTQTTSPLAPIMASIDLARAQMAAEGEALWTRAIELGHEVRRRTSALPGLRVLGPEAGTQPGSYDFDPVRVTISAAGVGCSGYALERLLRDECRVAVEAADPLNIVVNITHGDSSQTVDRLVDALAHAAALLAAGDAPLAGSSERSALSLPRFTRQVISPRDAFFGPVRTMALESAAGEVSAEMAIPYPPGVPVLGPGEEISHEIAAYLAEAARRGLSVHGPHDATLKTLRVVA